MKLRTLSIITASLVAMSTAALAQTATPTTNTPEQQQAMHTQYKADREAFHEKLKNATPEQRKQLIAERKAEWQKRYDAATPEEKARMDKHREKWQEMRAEHKADRQSEHLSAHGAPSTPGDVH